MVRTTIVLSALLLGSLSPLACGGPPPPPADQSVVSTEPPPEPVSSGRKRIKVEHPDEDGGTHLEARSNQRAAVDDRRPLGQMARAADVARAGQGPP